MADKLQARSMAQEASHANEGTRAKHMVSVSGSKLPDSHPIDIYLMSPKGSIATPKTQVKGVGISDIDTPMQHQKEGFGKKQIFGGFTRETEMKKYE